MSRMQLTSAGRVLLGKALLGKELKFCTVAYGSGDFDYSTEKVADLTNLKHWRMDLPIVGKKILNNGTVEIQARLQNFDVEEGFPAKEVGIYAFDPDTGDQILYAYRNAGDEYNFIPAKTGIIQKDTIFCYRVEIQDAPNVTAVVNFNFAYASQQDLESHRLDASPHPNIPNHFDDVASADCFWTTDFDNHLHKLSVDDAKKLLLPEIQNFLAEQKVAQADIENYRLFQRQGLSVNYIVDNELDDAEIEVTACVKDTTMIGLKSEVKAQEYILTDGANQESVKVLSAGYGSGSFRAVLAAPVKFDYDLNCTKLVRTYRADSFVRQINWQDNLFTGIEAGTARNIYLDNFAGADLQGDCILHDGFVTLNN